MPLPMYMEGEINNGCPYNARIKTIPSDAFARQDRYDADENKGMG